MIYDLDIGACEVTLFRYEGCLTCLLSYKFDKRFSESSALNSIFNKPTVLKKKGSFLRMMSEGCASGQEGQDC